MAETENDEETEELLSGLGVDTNYMNMFDEEGMQPVQETYADAIGSCAWTTQTPSALSGDSPWVNHDMRLCLKEEMLILINIPDFMLERAAVRQILKLIDKANAWANSEFTEEDIARSLEYTIG